jgi:hypothetical protein
MQVRDVPTLDIFESVIPGITHCEQCGGALIKRTADSKPQRHEIRIPGSCEQDHHNYLFLLQRFQLGVKGARW